MPYSHSSEHVILVYFSMSLYMLFLHTVDSSFMKPYRFQINFTTHSFECLQYRDPGSIPGSERAPGGGNSYQLQYSFPENSMGKYDYICKCNKQDNILKLLTSFLLVAKLKLLKSRGCLKISLQV